VVAATRRGESKHGEVGVELEKLRFLSESQNRREMKEVDELKQEYGRTTQDESNE
jgi:hypothetical protein